MKTTKFLIGFLFFLLLIINVLATTAYEYYDSPQNDYGAPRLNIPNAMVFGVGATAHTVTDIKILAERYGTTGIYSIGIVATSSGKPVGTFLTLNSAVDTGGWNNAAYEWHNIAVPEYTFVKNTNYAVEVFGFSATAYILWRCDHDHGYSNGEGYYSLSNGTDGTWVDYSVDFMFEIWGNSVNTFTFGGLMSINLAQSLKNSFLFSPKGIIIENLAQSDAKSFSLSKVGTMTEQFVLGSDSGKFYILGGGDGGITTINFPISADFVVLILTIIGCIFLCFIKIPLVAFIIAPFTISFSAYATTDINMPFYPNPIFCIFGAVIGIICFLINANFVYETGQKKYQRRKR